MGYPSEMADGPVDLETGRVVRAGRSKLGEIIDAARAEEREMSHARDVDPPSMPQVERELSMLTGLLSGVEQALARVVVKIEPVLKGSPAGLDKKPMREEHDWPCDAPIAARIHDLYLRLQDIEDVMNTTAMRVQL